MLIGVSGLAGSGKDTSADHLVRAHGFTKISFADPLKRIAREVYDFTEDQLWGPSANRNASDKRYLKSKHERHDWQEECQGWRCARCAASGEEAGPECAVYLTPRHALQALGTEWGRDCFVDTWVHYALRMAKKLEDLPGSTYSQKKGFQYEPALLTANPSKTSGVVIPDVRFQNEISALNAAGAKIIRVLRPSAGLAGAAGLHSSEKEQQSIPDSAFDAVLHNDASIEDLGLRLDMLIKAWT